MVSKYEVFRLDLASTTNNGYRDYVRDLACDRASDQKYDNVRDQALEDVGD